LDQFIRLLSNISKFNGTYEKFQGLVLYNYGITFPENENEPSSGTESISNKGSEGDNIFTLKNDEMHDQMAEFKSIMEKLKESFNQQNKLDANNQNQNNHNVLSLIKYPSQRYIFLFMCYMWFCTSGVYYGLTINIKNLPGNTYITGIVMFFVEAISYILSGNLINISFLGRKKTMMIFYIISLISYLIIIIFGIKDYWLTVLSLCARFCVSGVYTIIYTYSTEVYPTVVRSNGLGLNSVCGRVGGMLFPVLIEILHEKINYFFAGLNIGALAIIFILPETYGKILTDNIPEENQIKIKKIKTISVDDRCNSQI